MGQGMCAGIRDASNLAWKIVKCLKQRHSEKILDSYQSERFPNAKEYIETTMRMGEFVNAIESTQITDNISSNQDGTKSMQSIKPKLGPGLGKNKDSNRGIIFPQLKMKSGGTFDNKFSKNLLLIVSPELKIKSKLSKYPTIIANEVGGLSNLLKSYNSKAIIIRPDRFIFQSCNSVKNFSKFLKKLNNFN